MLVMRLFELTALPEKSEKFSAVGVHNLMSSLEKEAGTFFMTSTYEAGQPSKKVVFEIYQDDEAYQVHMASEHFGQFAAFAKDSFSERLVHTLVPEVTVEKAEQKAFSDASGLHLRLARVRVAQENAAAFKAIVAEEMATSVEVEAGVLALLAGRIARICRSGISLKSMRTSQLTRSTVSRHILRNILNSQLTLFWRKPYKS